MSGEDGSGAGKDRVGWRAYVEDWANFEISFSDEVVRELSLEPLRLLSRLRTKRQSRPARGWLQLALRWIIDS